LFYSRLLGKLAPAFFVESLHVGTLAEWD
jgi:hypothetical protein